MLTFRSLLAVCFSAGLKTATMLFYSTWALKLGVIDSDVNPAFSFPAVLLSIYGLWVIVGRFSEQAERLIEGRTGTSTEG